MAIQKNIDPSKYQIRTTIDDVTKSQIDWATVAGTLSDTFTDIKKDRDQRKQAIQDATDQAFNLKLVECLACAKLSCSGSLDDTIRQC